MKKDRASNLSTYPVDVARNYQTVHLHRFFITNGLDAKECIKVSHHDTTQTYGI